MKAAVKRALGAVGRPVRCELCGEVLFTAVPMIRRGRVKLVGAEQALVRVDFATMNELVYRHAEPAACPAQRAARGTAP